MNQSQTSRQILTAIVIGILGTMAHLTFTNITVATLLMLTIPFSAMLTYAILEKHACANTRSGCPGPCTLDSLKFFPSLLVGLAASTITIISVSLFGQSENLAGPMPAPNTWIFVGYLIACLLSYVILRLCLLGMLAIRGLAACGGK